MNHLRHYSTPFNYIQRFVDTQGWAPSAEVLKARVHGFRGESEAEAEALTTAIPHYPEPLASKMRLQLADIYLKLDRLDEAEKEIDRVAPNSGLSDRVEALRRILNSGARKR